MSDKDTPTLPGSDDGFNDITSKLSSLLSGPEEAEEEDQPTEPDPGSEEGAPDEDQASEESEGKDEPATPAIEPPSSWDAAAREKWKALSPDLQEFISTREQERERATNTKLQEAAEIRRAVEAQASDTARMRDAYEQRLHAFARHLEASVPEEFREIRSNADLVRLADTNPALVTKFHAWQAQVSSVAQEMAQIEQHKQEEALQARSDVLAREYDAISKVWPDFVDQQKGTAIRQELSAYAKERGFSDQEIQTLVDHRLVLVLKDAIAGRKAQSSLQQAKQKVNAKPLPKVVRPGSGEQSGKGVVDRGQAQRVAKGGNMNDIARTLERMLST